MFSIHFVSAIFLKLINVNHPRRPGFPGVGLIFFGAGSADPIRPWLRDCEILSNYLENKTHGALKILSSYFKNKGSPISFKLCTSKIKHKGSPRFFQITSKTKHKVSLRFFQTTSKKQTQGFPEISSNYFKNKMQGVLEFFHITSKTRQGITSFSKLL